MTRKNNNNNNNNNNGSDPAASPKIPKGHRGIPSETPSKTPTDASSSESDSEDSEQPEPEIPKTTGQFDADTPEGLWEQVENAKRQSLTLVQKQVRVLTKSFTQGRQDIGESEYKKQLGELEESVATYESEIAILLSCKNQFVGHFRDAEEYQDGLQGFQTDNWAYIDQLINRIGATHGATVTLHQKRGQDEQAKFRKDVIARYDPNHEDGWLWCVVSGASYSSDLVTAAHIANYNLGEPNACAIFGKCEEPTGHLKSPCNGLLMRKDLENAFDAGRFAIVQALFTNEETSRKERGLKVVVLDPTLEKDFHKDSGGRKDDEPIELNNRRLSFTTSRRPRNRYVYFKYAMTILRRQRLQVPGANLDRRFMDKAARSLWASPGSYLGRSLLFKIALQLGFLTKDEAMEFYNLRKAPPKLSPLEERRLKVKAYQVSSAMKTRSAASFGRCLYCGQHWDCKVVEYEDYTEDLSSQVSDLEL
ncbi:hypothetical protein CcaCcLH18_05769 [Colletotrichum camelliae]|nr:hypothetical protein CcaCcLH18_05769 [Colletotrichum camelliae]